MRAGILTYGLDRPLSGVTRVTQELGEALHRSGGCDVVFLTPYRDGPFCSPPFESYYLPGCRLLPGLMALGGPLIAAAAHRLGLDVVHDPAGVSPFTLGRWAGRFRRLTTIHDAIAFRYPEGYPWLNNFLNRRYVPATLRNLDGVITDSWDAAQDVERFLGVDPNRVHVVTLGVSAHFRPVAAAEASALARRYGLDGPFVLSVGAQQARKNMAGLLTAFAVVHRHRPDVRLALAGSTQWRDPALLRQLDADALEGAVVRLGYVPDADLPALYSAATVFAFPSLYEGFGLPVVEAMACGTAVVCSNATSLPEVAGDAAVLVDPRDPEALAGGLLRVLDDAALRDDLGRRGLARAQRFTWEEAARKTLEVYRKALGAE
jgi:glycosyltransferase involved in cell wall biosynthesis